MEKDERSLRVPRIERHSCLTALSRKKERKTKAQAHISPPSPHYSVVSSLNQSLGGGVSSSSSWSPRRRSRAAELLPHLSSIIYHLSSIIYHRRHVTVA
eukprot:scaffold1332_cov42-Attheya_sp.AAC.1